MGNQTVTIALPDQLYQQATERASRARLSLEDELITTVAVAYSRDEISADTRETLTQLEFLNDEELWRTAQLRVSPELHGRMETLSEKRQILGLSSAEKAESEQLVQHADHVMLVRAKAAALLRSRGHDVTALMQPPQR